MTKKDYVKIAGVFIDSHQKLVATGKSYALDVLSDLAQDLAVVFASDNPQFNQDRFLEACGL